MQKLKKKTLIFTDGKSAPTNWRKGKILGSGAFGKVYLAYDADTGRELAVKQVDLNNDNTQLITKVNFNNCVVEYEIVNVYTSGSQTFQSWAM